MPSATPIQPLLIGDAGAALVLSERLQRKQMLVAAIRPPTVPEGGARLRITLSANHTLEHIDRLLEALQ
jgi:8-amino-7-oxononanoate synthase